MCYYDANGVYIENAVYHIQEISCANHLVKNDVYTVEFTDEQIKIMSQTNSNGYCSKHSEEWNVGIEEGWIVPADEVTICDQIAVARVDGAVGELYGCKSIFPEKGLYFGGGFGWSHVVSLTSTEPVEQTKTVVKKLDPKYLPKGNTPLYVDSERLYHDEECTQKVSAAELDNMIFNGGVLLNVDGYLHFPLIYEYDGTYGSGISYMTYEGDIRHALTGEATSNLE